MAFAEWEAAIAAGATLDELYKWETGGYPKPFRARVIAWHNLHNLVEAHKNDAAAEKVKSRSKGGG